MQPNLVQSFAAVEISAKAAVAAATHLVKLAADSPPSEIFLCLSAPGNSFLHKTHSCHTLLLSISYFGAKMWHVILTTRAPANFALDEKQSMRDSSAKRALAHWQKVK